MSRIEIPVGCVEFDEGGHTLWVQGDNGTVLRIKATGRIRTEQCEVSPGSHADIMVEGDIKICLGVSDCGADQGVGYGAVPRRGFEDGKGGGEMIEFVIAETATATWHYHWREVVDGRLHLGGGAPPALCGEKLGWDTRIQPSVYGTKCHIPEVWCAACEAIRKERTK